MLYYAHLRVATAHHGIIDGGEHFLCALEPILRLFAQCARNDLGDLVTDASNLSTTNRVRLHLCAR